MGEGILDMKLFHLAVKLGSISRAGNIMNISRSAASKRVSNLESKFGGNLLIRNRDGIHLTIRGKIFFEKVEQILKNYDELHIEMDSANEGIPLIKICTTPALLSFYLSNAIKQILEENDDINLVIKAKDNVADLIKEQPDCFFMLKMEDLVDYKQEKMFDRKLNLYASTEYLDLFGRPLSVEDLSDHRIIVFGEELDYDLGIASWPLSYMIGHGLKKPKYITANSVSAMVKMAEQGMGIIGVSDSLISYNNIRLEKILESFTQETKAIYLITKNSLSPASEKVKFLELLKEVLGQLTH